MAAPENNVYVTGLGQVDGDALNTFLQFSLNVASMRSFIGVSGMTVYMQGTSSTGDGGQGLFYWNAGATNPTDDNGVTTIVPTGAGQGCWSRLANIITALNVNASPSISISPIGSPTIATETSASVQGVTNAPANAGYREFLTAINFTSSSGSAYYGVNNLGDKVALYVAIEAENGTGDVWSLNTVLNQDAGSGTYDAQGYELDFNNNNVPRGNHAGNATPSGYAAPVSYGLSITGAGSCLSTAAILVAGSSVWNRGLAVTGAIAQSGIEDVSASPVAYNLMGDYTYGIDFAGGDNATPIPANISSSIAIRLGNATFLGSRNAANNGDLQLIAADTNNNLLLGSHTEVNSTILSGGSTGVVLPSVSTDNLGDSVSPWSGLFAQAVVITASSPAMYFSTNNTSGPYIVFNSATGSHGAFLLYNGARLLGQISAGGTL